MTDSADRPPVALGLPERFRIERRLGAGGFGQVYAAWDRARAELVALKQLSEVNASNLLNFKQEFRVLSGMHHPHLVMLYELIEEQGTWCFTMELVDGVHFLDHVRGPLASNRGLELEMSSAAQQAPTLEGRIEAEAFASQDSLAARFDRTFLGELEWDPFEVGPSEVAFDEERLRHALVGLYHGVETLHGVGILHRDIKPSNVLVTPEGRVVLLDFGLIARITPQLDLKSLRGEQAARAIHYIGTPHYMSPEQAMGSDIGPASDWYSVGAMLYECLTGRRPIDGTTPLKILIQKQNTTPLPVSVLNPDAPKDLAELCMALLERDPRDRPDAAQIGAALDARIPPPHAPSSHIALRDVAQVTPFVGREAQIGQLEGALQRLRADRLGALVHVSGPSGIGKSSLVKRFLRQIATLPDVLVLEGRCFESESVPYKALDQLIDMLSRYLELLPHAQRDAYDHPDLFALSKLFPTLERRFDLMEHSEMLAHHDSGGMRRRAFEGLRRLLTQLGEQHDLVLFIDDVHWGDKDSALLLEHLLGPPDPPALLLICSWREEDVSSSPFLACLFEAQERWEGGLQIVDLGVEELPQQESEALARALLGERLADPAQLERITREAQGNPLFLDELARYVNHHGPEPEAMALDEVLFRRISALDPMACRLLESVCVAGQPLERQLARAIAGLESGEQSALSILKSELLLRLSPSGQEREEEQLDVYHARIRETVLAHMPRQALVELHAALAGMMSLKEEADPDRVAHHFLSAELPSQAVPFLLRGAEQATHALAFDHAARSLQLALDHGDHSPKEQHRLLCWLGALYGYLGRGVEAATVYQRAMRLAPAEERVDLERRIAEQLLRVGRFEQGSQILSSLLSRAGIDTPKSNARLLAEIAALRARLAWRGLDAAQQAQMDGTRRERAELVWSAAQMLSVMDLKLGAYFASLHLLDSLEHHDPDHLCLSLSLESVHATNSSKGRQKAQDLLDRAAALLPATRDRGYCEGFVCFARGMQRYLYGEWQAALDAFKEAEWMLENECEGVVWELDGARFYQFFCYEHQGLYKPFVERLPHFLDEAVRRQDLLYTTNWRLWSHLGHLATDQPERAHRELERAITEWATENFLIQHFWHLIGRARVSLYQREPAEALELIDARYTALKRSLLLQNESIAMLIEECQARLTLAMLLSPRRLEHKTLRKLRARHDRHMSALSRSTIPSIVLMYRALRAQLAWLDLERRTALTELELLEHDCLSHGSHALAHALRLLRARLIDDSDDPRHLQQSARAFFEAQRVARPERFAAMLCPLLGTLEPQPPQAAAPSRSSLV